MIQTFSFIVTPGSFISSLSYRLNGSSEIGGCDHYGQLPDDNYICYVAATSVLFDQRIPTINVYYYDWARELFTSQGSIEVAFSDNLYISRVEIVMFNCLQFGIGTEGISLGGSVYYTDNVTSCSSLVRVCLPCTRNCRGRSQTLYYNTSYLAEVEFYSSSGECSENATFVLSSNFTTANYNYNPTSTVSILVYIAIILLIAVPCVIIPIIVVLVYKFHHLMCPAEVNEMIEKSIPSKV